jgi:hypothetical protein
MSNHDFLTLCLISYFTFPKTYIIKFGLLSNFLSHFLFLFSNHTLLFLYKCITMFLLSPGKKGRKGRDQKTIHRVKKYQKDVWKVLVVTTSCPMWSFNPNHKVRTYKEYHSVCPSSELGLPQPPTRRLVCPLPPVSGGRGTLAGEKEVGRVPILTRGIHCGTLYMYVLCDPNPHGPFYVKILALVKITLTLHRKFETNIPGNEAMWPRSQFLHSCIRERFIPVRLFCGIVFGDRWWEYINRSQIHECRN